jgi:Type IV secretion system pilin
MLIKYKYILPILFIKGEDEMLALLKVKLMTILLLQNSGADPFGQVNGLLNNLITQLMNIAIPIAALGIIFCAIGAMIATDEATKSKFKKGIIYTAAAFVICILAPSIINWIGGNMNPDAQPQSPQFQQSVNPGGGSQNNQGNNQGGS